jgi:hypothetical protein
MGASPRWLRGSCCRSCPPEAAAPCVLRRDQAGVPSQSMPLLLSHCRVSLDRSGEGDGLTSRPVIRTPPFAPTWTAVSSPCSRMRRSKSGGHLSRTRRPQSGQTHSSPPDSAWPLRIISCVSRTDVTYLGIQDNLGHFTQRMPVRHELEKNIPYQASNGDAAPEPVAATVPGAHDPARDVLEINILPGEGVFADIGWEPVSGLEPLTCRLQGQSR